MNTEVLKTIKEIIKINIDKDADTKDRIKGDLGMDSLDVAELGIGIELELGIEVTDEYIAKISAEDLTVGQVAEYVSTLVN